MKKSDTKALTSQEDIETLRSLTGEGNRSKISIPKISIDYRMDIDEVQNPNYGGFCIVNTEKGADGSFKKTMEPIGKTFEGVILRRRNMAKNYNAESQKTEYYTREFDSWTEPLEVFNSDGVSAGVDFYKKQKDHFKLKPSMILYVWYKDNIYRLQLSASSMFSYGDYEAFFRDSSVCLVTTEISTKRERKSPSSPPYFVGAFKQVGEFDYMTARGLVKSLDDALRSYEQSREPKREPDFTDPDEREKISVEDLPF